MKRVIVFLLILGCVGIAVFYVFDLKRSPLLRGWFKDLSEPVPPYFERIGKESGLTDRDGKRCAFYDMDGDGWLDVLLDSNYIFLNRSGKGGQRIFVDHSADSGISMKDEQGHERKADMAIMGDVDNDGDLDLYSSLNLAFQHPAQPTPDYGFRSAILLNDGSARFSLVQNSGVESNPGTECAAAFLDYDNDGCLDLAVGYWYKRYGESYEAYPNRLYKGNGDGTFRDVTVRAGMMTVPDPDKQNSARPTFGVTHGDWNNDGYQDILFMVYGRQRNYHWCNNGDGTFTEIGEETGFWGDALQGDDQNPWFRQNGNTFSGALGDYDNDGDLDLYLGEITHAWAGPASDRSQLLINLGQDQNYRFERDYGGTFRKHGPNWNQGDLHVSWIDFNYDGLTDLLIASGEYPDGQFLSLWQQATDSLGDCKRNCLDNITDRAGFNWEGSAGLSVGDYDRDGDPDILVGRSLMRLPDEKAQQYGLDPGLFRNLAGDHNYGLTVRFVGQGKGYSNRQGIGSRAYVTVQGRTMMGQVLGGGGHSGQMNAQELYFGLGKSETADELRVIWPSAQSSEQIFRDLQGDRLYIVKQGEPELETWNP